MEVNKESHFVHRQGLYQRLGILAGNIRGRKVLEFGPGNGVNALFTLSMQPEECVLVDANPTGIKNCTANLSRFYPGENWKIVDSLIEDFNTDQKFDLVICEGLLPNQVNPSQMARHCGSFVSPGGVYVVTCHDAISLVSETLRCLLGWLLVRNTDDFSDQVAILAQFFASHLEHLEHVTRPVEDWVIDNVLQTEFWQDSPLFTIAEAIDALCEDFAAHGTSPWFLQDWSWYKSVGSVRDHFNKTMTEGYWANVHNLIDWRVVSKPRSITENRALGSLCSRIRAQAGKAPEDTNLIEQLVLDLEELAHLLPEENMETRAAISSYVEGMRHFLKVGLLAPEMFGDFGAWWGRATQYCSFVKL